MPRFLPLTVTAGLLAAASTAYAQVAPVLTVNFSPLNAATSTTPVPLGPLTVGLSILAIGGMLAYASRKGKKHWLSLPAVAALVGIGLSQPSGIHAEPEIAPVQLSTSPSTTSFPEQNFIQFTLVNSKSYAVRLDSISVSPEDEYVLGFRPTRVAARDSEFVGECVATLVLAANEGCFGFITKVNPVPSPG